MIFEMFSNAIAELGAIVGLSVYRAIHYLHSIQVLNKKKRD